jgi:hypothetical protein
MKMTTLCGVSGWPDPSASEPPPHRRSGEPRLGRVLCISGPDGMALEQAVGGVVSIREGGSTDDPAVGPPICHCSAVRQEVRSLRELEGYVASPVVMSAYPCLRPPVAYDR